MNRFTKSARAGSLWRHSMLAFGTLLAGLFIAFGPRLAFAAPAAGTVIGNQATATYNDATGTARSATSNLVQTTVSQVRSYVLAPDGAKTAAPGQTVYYPHTIINTGNGTDTYALNALASSSFGAAGPHTSLAYFLDNGSGFPVGGQIFSSGPLASGATFKFLVAGTVPGAAANASTATITVSVTDNSGAGTNQTKTDTTTVANSVINVTKGLAVISGPSPSAGPIKVTLSYTNAGTAVATAVQITDLLPAGMEYVTGSARWSVSGAANALTEVSDGIEQAGAFPPGIDFRYVAGAVFPATPSGTVTAIIPSVNAGVSGNVTFDVTIRAALPPQALNNTAQYQTATQASANTNTASYTVLQTAAVVANGSNASSANGASEPVIVATAAAGSTFTFDNFIWNRGNGTDTFDITTTANSFPPGTTITLLQQDGVTSLINSAGTAAPDTGPIPGAGAICAAPFVSDGTFCGYKVVVRVTLPASAVCAGPGCYSITNTATSVFDTGVSDTVIDTLNAVGANVVDLTNDNAAPPAGGATLADGLGAGTTTIIRTNTVSPAVGGPTTTAFQVQVTNLGAVTDTFNLSATPVAALPTGWSVVFRLSSGGNCNAPGAVITATSPLPTNTAQLVCAVVTVPAAPSGNATPGNYDIDFRAVSQTNPAVNDVIRDRVTVATVHSVSLTPNNTQQTFPGGAVTYSHTITNSGNAPETVSFPGTCLTDSRALWSSTAYIDAAPVNGVLDIPGDTLIVCGATTQLLAVGETRNIYVRVFAPGSATAADPANQTTLTATYTCTPGPTCTTSATDTTSVTDGLLLLKEQAPVACAAAGPHAGYTQSAIPTGPSTAPGQCIAYRVTGTNTTAANITSVVINDIVPANTRMQWSCSGNGVAQPSFTVGGGPATNIALPVNGATGTVSANVGTLTPGQLAVLYFCVQINP